jgi:hypothetical protein
MTQTADMPTFAHVPRPATTGRAVATAPGRPSYLYPGAFTQFAREVLEVLAYAVTVPVAFTEGFLKAYLSIDRVEEDEDGRLSIIPRSSAELDEIVRDADEIVARIDRGAVYNPVVRAGLEDTHQVGRSAMRWSLDELSAMDDAQLMDVLRAMQDETQRRAHAGGEECEEARDHIRVRIATIRRNMGRFGAANDV